MALFLNNSVKAQRLLTAASLRAPEHLEELSRQLFQRSWSNVSSRIAHPGAAPARTKEVSSPAGTRVSWPAGTRVSWPTAAVLPTTRAKTSPRMPACWKRAARPSSATTLHRGARGLLALGPGRRHAAANLSAPSPVSLLAATGDSDVKDTLKATTAEAVERGVFGAPTMFAGGEMFFGSDRFELMAHRLGGWDLVPRIEEWGRRQGCRGGAV